MYAPITVFAPSHASGSSSDPPGTPDPFPPNLLLQATNAHDRERKIGGQPTVTRQELGLYTI
jgi:hypothetical protein